MKSIKTLLATVGTVALLAAGCATDNQGQGGMGTDSETGIGGNYYNPDQVTPDHVNPPPASVPNGGANGSVSPRNPFGTGSTGLTPG